MPVARFQLPDGRVARFEVPEGTSPEQAQQLIQAQLPSIGQPAAAPAAPSEVPGPRKEPPMWEKVRPYVAPTVEALGAGAGALIGGGAGTLVAPGVGTAAGGVAGAGLGYGIAKEALELGDVYLGGKAPRQGAAQVVEPVKNILEGATYEAGGRVAGPLIAKGVGKLADLRQIPMQKAARVAKDVLGEDLAATVNALKTAPPGASVADVTANIKNPAWQALVRDSLERTPEGAKYLNALRDMTDEQAVNALAKLAGGTTAAETRGTTELAKKNLNVITTPMREAAVGRANLGKYVASEAAAREANDLATMVGSGGAIDPARFATQATGAEQALRSVGVKPLEGAPLAERISAISKNPAFAENDLIEGATQKVAEGIRKWTASNGVIDANALEAIRKNAVDAAIAKLRPGMDATSQRNAAAGVMSRIKPLIDDAIEGAGGEGWREYLKTHAQGMQKIAEKKLTGEALRLWKTDKDSFVRLVQNESPEAVEKILGPGKYNIAVELADNTMSTLRDQAQKRLTELSVNKQVSEGQKALATVLSQEAPKFRLPSFLTFWATATNKALSTLESAIGTKSMKILSDAMRSPEGAANLLETLPATERSRVLQLMSDPSKWSAPTRAATTGTIAAGANMLAPDNENQNSLAR